MYTKGFTDNTYLTHREVGQVVREILVIRREPDISYGAGSYKWKAVFTDSKYRDFAAYGRTRNDAVAALIGSEG